MPRQFQSVLVLLRTRARGQVGRLLQSFDTLMTIFPTVLGTRMPLEDALKTLSMAGYSLTAVISRLISSKLCREYSARALPACVDSELTWYESR